MLIMCTAVGSHAALVLVMVEKYTIEKSVQNPFDQSLRFEQFITLCSDQDHKLRISLTSKKTAIQV